MADSFVRVPPDSTGKYIDTQELNNGVDTVQRQVVVLGDAELVDNMAAIGNIVVTDVLTAISDQVIIELKGREFVQVLMYGTFTTVTTAFEASPNSTNGTDGDWFNVRGVRLNANTVETGTASLGSGNYGWRVTGLVGMKWFRVIVLAGMSGNANVVLSASPLSIDPIPASEGGPATQSGTWFVTQNGRADGGDGSQHHLVSAATTNATLISNIARSMGVVNFSNNGATAAYLKLYNSSTIPTAGAGTPSKVIMAPPMSTIVVSGPIGMRFTAGLGYTITGGAANTDTTAVALDQCIVGITYS